VTRLAKYLGILPSTMDDRVVFPPWNKIPYRPGALMAKYRYGWARAFAVLDIPRGRQMGWQATGGAGRKTTDRRGRAVAVWGDLTATAWGVAATVRAAQLGLVHFSQASTTS